MDDVRHAAEERAARPKKAPVGSSFESERQREKNALVRQLDAQDGRNVHKISAAPEIPEGERVLRVAAYCRVSTDDIDQKLSIHLQIQQYMKRIKENPNWKYAGCYVDDGFSGTNTAHRQGFQKLMKDAMDGKIDMIITKAVSRFARNLMDCIGWVEALQNHDPPVRVFFEQENLDTMSQTSGIILFVLAMVAQEESHMKSEAILLSLEWRFSRGRFLTPRLFGYDKVEVPDGFGGKKKVLSINESEARVVRWMYSTLVNGGSPEEIAEVLTEMAIPTGGRRRDGTLNTHWTAGSVVSIMRNEKHCGDVLARKTYTPNYKDHKSKKNNGKKNKYFQPDHHEAIVSRATWNAAQRILNSRKYRHEGTYLPMRIIDHGALTGYISMNRSWAGFDFEDYYRAGQIAMGLLDEDLEVDLETEYLPEAGRKIGGLVEVARRDVGVHEPVVVVQEYRLDTVHVFERGRVTELEQAVRLLVQKQRGRLGLLVNLFLFPVNGLLHVFMERGPVLVERFLREEYFVLDVAETQERQYGRGEHDSPGKQRKEQEVVFGELDSHAASLQGEARRYAWE